MRIATAKVQQNLRICKKNRILVRFFTRRGNQRALNKWWVLGVGTRETGIRRAEDREHGTRKVLDGDTVVTEWYRNSNEMVSRKIAGKKHIEGRMKVRGR